MDFSHQKPKVKEKGPDSNPRWDKKDWTLGLGGAGTIFVPPQKDFKKTYTRWKFAART